MLLFLSLEQVQVALLRLLPAEAILIGHSLDCDLRALHLSHARCVDTAVIFPHPRGYPLRLKLRKLAEDFLQQRIQCHGDKGSVCCVLFVSVLFMHMSVCGICLCRSRQH